MSFGGPLSLLKGSGGSNVWDPIARPAEPKRFQTIYRCPNRLCWKHEHATQTCAKQKNSSCPMVHAGHVACASLHDRRVSLLQLYGHKERWHGPRSLQHLHGLFIHWPPVTLCPMVPIYGASLHTPRPAKFNSHAGIRHHLNIGLSTRLFHLACTFVGPYCPCTNPSSSSAHAATLHPL